MAELLNGLKRTDMCGNLRKNDENREVVVMGFVAKTRDLGNLVFIDLRDRTGIVQLAFDAGVDARSPIKRAPYAPNTSCRQKAR